MIALTTKVEFDSHKVYGRNDKLWESGAFIPSIAASLFFGLGMTAVVFE